MDRATRIMVEQALEHFQRYSQDVKKRRRERPPDFFIERTLRLYRGSGESGDFRKLADFVQPASLPGLGQNPQGSLSPAGFSFPAGAFAGLVTGSYGTGKTELGFRLCESLWARKKKGRDAAVPTPFLLSLSRCRSRLPLLDSRLGTEEFIELLRQGLPDKDLQESPLWNELRAAVREGKVFLVLDALDELVVDNPTRHEHFIRGLHDFLLDDKEDVSKACFRVLVTMRREYLSAVDEPRITGTLQAWSPAAANTLYLLELNQFGDSEILEYFERRLGNLSSDIFDDIVQVPDFLSVLRRPLLLRIFVDYLAGIDDISAATQELTKHDRAKAGALIKAYVDQVHERGKKLQEELGSIYYWSRKKLAKRSKELFANGEFDMTQDDIREIRIPLAGSEGTEDPLVSIHKCPFLLREGERVRFAHKTFFEFFVAKGIADEVDASPERDEAEGFNNLVVNPDTRKFLQFFLDDFWELIKTSCGLKSSEGWDLSEEEYTRLEKPLDTGLRTLTEGMTDPEVQRDDVEMKIDWFLKECDPKTFHPGYLVYCSNAVATYMLAHPWTDKFSRWRDQFEGFLQVSLERALKELNPAKGKHQKPVTGKYKEWLERLVERVLFNGRRLHYPWVETKALTKEEWLHADWHPQTRNRINSIIEEIEKGLSPQG